MEILEETERLRRLLDDFLHYARPMELRRVEVDMVDLWDRGIEEARALYPETVFRRSAVSGERSAHCDPDRLRQIALNLLANAASFSPDGGEVLVSITQEGRSLRIGIQDQGSGVQEELREKLFDPFVSGREGGTGLGLALSRSLAQAHGGDLTLESSSSEGSEFRLTLPLQSKGQVS
jgi:signal transduction histidine kinase